VWALAGSMSDVGIDGRFIHEVRKKVTLGTSALFLMTSDVVQGKVLEHFRGTGAQLVSTNLSKDQEQRLREVFGEEQETKQPPEARYRELLGSGNQYPRHQSTTPEGRPASP
jgi:uncharacterized membrane protein